MEVRLARMTFLCKYCGQVWLNWSPEHRPVTESGEKHDCPNAPWNLARKRRARAKAVTKEELKIQDHEILCDIRERVRHSNNRLANYVLDLHVEKKFPEGEEA